VDWVEVDNVKLTGSIQLDPNNVAVAQVHDAGDALGSTSQSVEDIAAFSVLTEELGYAPSPLARPSSGAGVMAPAAGGALGQIAAKAVSDVLGWQAKPDPKGFLGALNASFSLKEVDGHTEAIWTPRTYAIQTDLSGITGAQASVYQRAGDALDKRRRCSMDCTRCSLMQGRGCGGFAATAQPVRISSIICCSEARAFRASPSCFSSPWANSCQ
jgi:hypothetical protein